MASHRWEIPLEDSVHSVEYAGTLPTGEARVIVDGEAGAHNLVLTIGSRYRAVFACAGHECALEMDTSGEDVTLSVDGVVRAELPPEAPAATTGSALTGTGATAEPGYPPEVVKWARYAKSGMSSFLTLVILTALNCVLYLADAPISFPFSAFAPTLCVGFGQLMAKDTSSNVFLIVGIVFGVLLIGLYAGLYLLARKRTWPVWVAFALIVLDTALVVLFLSGDNLVGSLVDLAFHTWVIGSLLRLGVARHKLKPFLRPAPAADAAPVAPDAPPPAPKEE